MPWFKEHTRPARRRGRARRRYPVAVTFHLIDAVDECSADRIVATHTVDPEVEYLQDHFPTFHVLPGVMMLETMVQAARRLLRERDPSLGRCVLGAVRALKYGAMVRPGQSLRVEVALLKQDESGAFEFKGSGVVSDDAGAARTAVSGRFSLRPIRIDPPETP